MNGLKQLSLRFSFILLFVLSLSYSCKDDYNSSIPYVRVNFSIPLANNNDLLIPGNCVYFSAGYGGVIVMYTDLYYSPYYAFDAACPYEADPACRITVEGGIGTCSCCGTQYNLWDGGSVLIGTGPGIEPLKQYQVTRSDNRLYITN